MPSAEHRIGTCQVIASARLAGEQGHQRPRGRRRHQPHRARLPRGPGRAGAALPGGPGRRRRPDPGRPTPPGSHADAVYGEPRAASALAEARARRNFEPGRRPRP